MDSASSASLSSSVVFPAAPDSMVPLDSLFASSSLAVEGARVLGCAIGCLSMGLTCPVVCTLSSNMSHQ